ncbi:GP179 protein, partial [Eurystomus gularis]|nr:GP179 protein [Eurystomus gularis]
NGSIHPQGHAEMEQPHAKPIASSPHPSTSSVWRVAAKKPGAEVCPQGALGVPAGRGALLHQEVMASREDSGVPPGEESLGKVLEKEGSQLKPLRTGGSQGLKRVPTRSWSTEVAPAAVGKAGRAVGRQAEVCPGETWAESSIKMEICPWEESEDKHWGQERAPGKGSSEGDPQHPGEEKPVTKTPEMLKAASEKAESEGGRRAEVCPWEGGEEERTIRAEICPWDGSSQQGSPRPREGAEQPSTGLPALPKTSSKQGEAIESKKVDICPWEVEGELVAKTEICPWEEPAAPSGKEKPSQDTRETSRRENKPGTRGLD